MNRFKRAWLALFDKLPPVQIAVPGPVRERVVIGDATVVELYRATAPYKSIADWNGQYFSSCTQAFCGHADATVVKTKAIKVDGEYFLLPTGGLQNIKVTR